MSYVIDVYRNDKDEHASFGDVLLYISLFPQLIAGPIVKYNTIRTQIHDRSVNASKMASGIRLFIIGLSKKMLISNVMGAAADKILQCSHRQWICRFHGWGQYVTLYRFISIFGIQ